MIVFTLLALGLSRAGKSSRTERALILACAAASAYMNVSAADTASPRSVVAYAVAPVALAVVVDRVVAVIRRHVLADEEASAWTALGRALAGRQPAGRRDPRSTRCASSWRRRRPPGACAGWCSTRRRCPACRGTARTAGDRPAADHEAARAEARPSAPGSPGVRAGSRPTGTGARWRRERLAPLVGLATGTARAYIGGRRARGGRQGVMTAAHPRRRRPGPGRCGAVPAVHGVLR